MDGDNVLHALGLVRGRDLSAGEGFLTRLERVAAEKDWEVIAVFDGPERFFPRESGPLVVRYAKPKQSADAVIERMVYEASRTPPGCGTRPEGVIVVTGDRAVGDLVAGFSALVWLPERLQQEMAGV